MPALRRILLRMVLAPMLIVPSCKGKTDTVTPAAASQPAATQPIVRTAERGPLKVTVTADRNRVEIPEHVKLTLRIQAEAGIEVKAPKLEGVFGDFGVAAVTENEPDCPQYAQCREWVYTLDSFLPGTREIPGLTFSFRDPREKADGSQKVYEDEVKTEPMAIEVTQALADVKGPVKLPMPFRYKLLWWAIGAVAVMVLIALTVRWWRRRLVDRSVPAARSVPAHLWALEQLDRLAGEDLIGRGRIQEFYYRINGLLRRYIELRFGLMAGEQTSEEFLQALQHSAALAEDHKTMLQEFVRACDPVKYAQHRPEVEEITWVQDSARDFVLQTGTGASDRQDSSSHREPTAEAVA